MVGDVHEVVEYYDLMSIVMICLGTQKDERYTGLLKLLDVFMSEVADMDTKTKVLKSEFGANMPEKLQNKEVKMCTYSEFVENRGIKKGKAEALLNLMRKLKMTLEQALNTLSIPESEWEDYRTLIEQMQAAQPAQ